jgi:hypothetical protein
MTGSITNRVASAPTGTPTKRVVGAVTAGNAQRVTAAAALLVQKALSPDGAKGDVWKSTWGEVEVDEAGSGANTFFRTFVGWYSINRSNPRDSSDKRVGVDRDSITSTTTKRVTETPQS